MRMFLLCFLLFLPLTAKALCSDHNDHQGDCINAAGCYYLSNSGNCTDCPSNSNANSTGYYCPQNGTCVDGTPSDDGRCQCPTPFNLSTLGNADIENCYADIDCYNYDDSVERCEHHYDNDINCSRIRGAHIENINGNDTCYAGSRRCRLFGSENCSESEISGTATRISGHSGNEWDISSCSCGVADFEDSTTLFCHGKQSGVRPSSSTVSNAGVAINYNGSRDGYYCTRCVLDNGNIKYYANTTDSNGTQCSPGGNHVCKCETSSELGYWREGKCNSGTDWTGNNTGNNICKRVSCPVGKTTNEILPTDILGCHYSRDTKFCDANGCFNITDAGSGNWDWDY